MGLMAGRSAGLMARARCDLPADAHGGAPADARRGWGAAAGVARCHGKGDGVRAVGGGAPADGRRWLIGLPGCWLAGNWADAIPQKNRCGIAGSPRAVIFGTPLTVTGRGILTASVCPVVVSLPSAFVPALSLRVEATQEA